MAMIVIGGNAGLVLIWANCAMRPRRPMLSQPCKGDKVRAATNLIYGRPID